MLLPRQLATFIRDSAHPVVLGALDVRLHGRAATRSREGDFPSLKRIIWCGEVLQPAVLAYWMRRVPHCTYTNLYGPTEATIASSYYTVASDSRR